MKKRVCALLLATIMVVSLLPANLFVLGAGDVAEVDGYGYPSFDEAWKVATSSSFHTFTLLADWTTSKCLEVPENITMTIDMGDHIINRNNTKIEKPDYAEDSSGSGTVFHVQKKATLKITGASLASGKQTAKKGKIASSGVWFLNNSGSDVINGAIITGGGTDSAKGGGAFRIEEGAYITLQNVTIAGNIADKYGTFYGNGGAIKIIGDTVSLTLVNSSIKYNYANRDGGGIYVDGENCRINMINSKIDNNVAGTDGGGIFAKQELFELNMTSSSISQNKCDGDGGGICYALYSSVERTQSFDSTSIFYDNHAGDDGGAIYAGGEAITLSGATYSHNRAKNGGAIYYDNDGCVISNAVFEGNHADKQGGAIYLRESDCVVQNCNIFSNEANEGGGIYNDSEDNTLDSVKIENNTAFENYGGMFSNDDNIFSTQLTINGTTYIRNNKLSNGKTSNLILDYGTYLKGEVGTKSEIHVETEDTMLSNTPGTFYSYAYFIDNTKTPKHAEWDEDKNSKTYRYLLIKDGAAEKKALYTEELAPKEAKGLKEATTTDKNNKQKTLTYTVPSFEDTKKNIAPGTYTVYQGLARDETENGLNLYYYTDGYFFNDPTVYDAHLATMSIVLEMSAFNATYNTDRLGNNIAYKNRFRGVKQTLADIGCDDDKTYICDDYTIKPTKDTIGFAIGQKPLKKADGSDSGYTLVPIVVRGQGYEAEWVSNVTLGSSKEAAGFGGAAEKVFTAVKAYIEKYGLTAQKDAGKLRFWVVGYSRAGATANLTSRRLIDEYQESGNVTYGYTFEAPQGGVPEERKDGSTYPTIHNSINYNDFVPYVAPVDMGFMRYGVDHFVPGRALQGNESTSFSWHYANSLNSKATVTGNFYTRDNMWIDTMDKEYSAQLEIMRKQLAAVSATQLFDDYFHIGEINTGTFLFTDLIGEVGSGDVSMGDFIQDFFHVIQVWGFQPDNRLTYNTKYEKGIQKLVGTIMSLSDQAQLNLISRKGSFIARLPILFPYILPERFTRKPNMFLSLYDATLACLIGSRIVADDCIPVSAIDEDVITMLANIVKNDLTTLCNNTPGNHLTDFGTNSTAVLLGTFLYNVSNIVRNHMPPVNYAWLRSYDSFYTDEGNKAAQTLYTLKQTSEPVVEPPVARINGKPLESEYIGEQILKLIPTDQNKGGAIYYQLCVDGKLKSLDSILYNEAEGIRLSPSTSGNACEYIITAYTEWFDTPSRENELKITIKPDTPHTVTVNDTVIGSFTFNQKVVVSGDKDLYDFIKWELPADVTLTSGDVTTPDIVFTMSYNDIVLSSRYQTQKVKTPKADIPEGLFNKDTSVHFSTETEGATIRYSVNRYIDDSAEATKIDVTGDTLELTAEKNHIVKYEVAAVASKNGLETSDPMYAVYILDKKSDTINITIHATDNANWSRDYSYSTKKGEKATITVPDVKDELFVEWLDTSSIKIGKKDKNSPTIEVDAKKDVDLYVRYAPVINAIEMTIPTPVAGLPFPEKAENCSITVTNVYSLDSLGVALNISWSPETEYVGYDRTYTATIPLDQVQNYDFAIGPEPVIIINNGTVEGHLVTGENGPEICCTFPKTEPNKLNVICPPDTVYFPHGTTKEAIMEGLPTFISLGFINGSSALAPIVWNDFEYSSSILDAQAFTVKGSIDLSSIENPDKLSNQTMVKVVIDSAVKTLAPIASVMPGSYDEEQYVVLKNQTENAKIYYTLDGSVPTENSFEFIEAIEIPGSIGKSVETTLQAVAIAEGMQESSILTNTYTISLPEAETDPTPTPEAVTPTPAGSDNPTPTPVITQTPSGKGQDKKVNPVIWIVISVAVAGAAAAGTILLIRKKKQNKNI